MMGFISLGVVIWSDADDGRAVIWCDDHGDLAYYSGEDDAVFAPGDLVRFRVERDLAMRRAFEPELVQSAQYPSLPGQLATAGRARRTQMKTMRRAVPVTGARLAVALPR
jgi:hypothetical protein